MKHSEHIKYLSLTVYGHTRAEAQAKALKALVADFCGDWYRGDEKQRKHAERGRKR